MRNTIDLPDNSPIHIHYGTDHAIGRFLDITDDRFAGTDADEQGEGYVFEWSQVFGVTTNLIGAKIEDIDNQDKLIELTNKFSRRVELTIIKFLNRSQFGEHWTYNLTFSNDKEYMAVMRKEAAELLANSLGIDITY